MGGTRLHVDRCSTTQHLFNRFIADAFFFSMFLAPAASSAEYKRIPDGCCSSRAIACVLRQKKKNSHGKVGRGVVQTLRVFSLSLPSHPLRSASILLDQNSVKSNDDAPILVISATFNLCFIDSVKKRKHAHLSKADHFKLGLETLESLGKKFGLVVLL